MKLILIAIIFLLAGCGGNGKETNIEYEDTPVASDGEIHYKANCASCHKLDKDFTGPPMIGALARWGGNKKAMYDFIRRPLESKTAYAKALIKKWFPTLMPAFNLSDAQIDLIMNYCENYVKPAVGKAVPQ